MSPLLIRRSLVRAQVEEPKNPNESSPCEKSLGLFSCPNWTIAAIAFLHWFGGGDQGYAERLWCCAAPMKKGRAHKEPYPSWCFLRYGKRHDSKTSFRCERKCGPSSCMRLLYRGWISVAGKFCSGFPDQSITGTSAKDIKHTAARKC